MKAIKRLPVELNPDNVIKSILYSFTQARVDRMPVKMLRMPEMNITLPLRSRCKTAVLYPTTDHRGCQDPRTKSRGDGERGCETPHFFLMG